MVSDEHGGTPEPDEDAYDLLKFADEYVEPVLAGEKRATIRLDLDAAFPSGERVLLADADGTPFASAVIDDRGYTTVEMAAQMDLDGHQSYDSTDALIDQFRGYYPDEEIGPNTRVELIHWDIEMLRAVDD